LRLADVFHGGLASAERDFLADGPLRLKTAVAETLVAENFAGVALRGDLEQMADGIAAKGAASSGMQLASVLRHRKTAA